MMYTTWTCENIKWLNRYKQPFWHMVFSGCEEDWLMIVVGCSSPVVRLQDNNQPLYDWFLFGRYGKNNHRE